MSKRQHEVFSQANSGRRMPQVASIGVLATEFHVPDWFAAAFTEELYKHFLSGKPIGEALLATRHHFWEQQSNLLGLAYALYSSPSIRIANSN